MTNGHIVLVGLMGTGKTTVGRKLARRLGLEFRDTDVEIEKATGRSIREIFEIEGEAAFRVREEDLLSELLKSPSRMVVATGGGVVLSESNRKCLSRSRVVWLRATVPTLLERLSSTRGAAKRPLLDGGVEARLTGLLMERRGLYQEVAHRVVDVDGLTSDQVCEIIVASGMD